jgi:hypothetical protein
MDMMPTCIQLNPKWDRVLGKLSALPPSNANELLEQIAGEH